jgi:hypothetical protein
VPALVGVLGTRTEMLSGVAKRQTAAQAMATVASVCAHGFFVVAFDVCLYG